MKARFEPARRAFPQRIALAAALAAAMPAFATETAVLPNPAPQPNAEMAYGVGVDQGRIVLGTPGENSNVGAVYVVDCSMSPCAAAVRLAPADLAAGGNFGAVAAISGDTLVATMPNAEPGAAYVYVRSGSNWVQQAKLTPSGGSSGEHFGASAAISGERIAVGADRADAVPNTDAGAVYVFVRSGTAWIQEARLTAADATPRDALGASVSIDADTIVAGAPIKSLGLSGSYGNGAAFVFVRGGGGWSQQAKLVSPNAANGDLFGYAVAVNGDRAVVGAPYASAARGDAYVFARSGSAWSSSGALVAAAAAPGDEFGWSVALDATKIVVGAPFTGQAVEAACGRAYLFDAATLAEAHDGVVSAPVLNELAGWSVAIGGGQWLASAPGRPVDVSEHAGAAYWFDGDTVFRAGFDAEAACVAAVGED